MDTGVTNTMTRKDFELIAQACRDSLHYQTLGEGPGRVDTITASVTDTAQRLANSLATTNQNFDRERFLTACGVDGVTK